MSEGVTHSRVPWHALQAGTKRVVLRRTNGTEIVVDNQNRAQSFTETAILLPWNDVAFVAAAYPWPTLMFRWRDRSRSSPFERTELVGPDTPLDNAVFAETIRRIVRAAEGAGVRGDYGWLALPPPGGKPLGELGIGSMQDGRAHVVNRVFRDWRATLRPLTLASDAERELACFPAVNISFNAESVVLGSVAPASFELRTDGISFDVDDITHVKFAEPWPLVTLDATQNQFEQKIRIAPQRNEELVFEAAMERIAAIVSLRAKSRVVRGWLDRPHAYVDIVDRMPDLNAAAAPGGAFRTNAESHADPVEQNWKREAPSVFERAFGGELGPYELTLTREFVYAALEPNVFVRYARADFHGVEHVGNERFLIFGRGTPLRIPNAFDAASLIEAKR